MTLQFVNTACPIGQVRVGNLVCPFNIWPRQGFTLSFSWFMHFLLSSNEKRKRCFADVFNENPYSLLHFCINLGDIKNVCNKFNHFCQFCLKFHRERRSFPWPLVKYHNACSRMKSYRLKNTGYQPSCIEV